MIAHISDTRNFWKPSLIIVGLLALASPQGAASSASDGDMPDTYTWSAELVALDESANTVTVKSRMVSHAEIEDVSVFSEGDQIMLTWSGAHSSASGVRNLRRGTDAQDEAFTMPVEFVSSERDGQYVIFKVPAPSSDMDRIKTLTPGVWVTATSPQQPSGEAATIEQIRPYSDG